MANKLAELILKELEGVLSKGCKNCEKTELCEKNELYCKDLIVDAIDAVVK